ncbi:MAG: trypsin-like peptidase domain-containing protein [Phycisphaerales bacterium]|nr:trypsin-like peptidase domain-containing protein [Phycisphaerales bacterium]
MSDRVAGGSARGAFDVGAKGAFDLGARGGARMMWRSMCVMLLTAACEARALSASTATGPEVSPTHRAQDPAPSAPPSEAQRLSVIDRVSPAVVCIFDPLQRGGGSGVILDEQGYGLTNFHVVADMLAERRGLAGLSSGYLYDLEVLGIDPGGDVAMFRLTGQHEATPSAHDPSPAVRDPSSDARDAGAERYPFAPLGDSDAVRLGDPVLAMGNPFVLAEDYTPTVTSGRVTGMHRYQYGEGNQLLYSDCIQTDAAINPGNSGGPLFNLRGEVIGINGRISINTRGRFNVGVGYAISANQIQRFIPGLRAGLLVRHGTLQATVIDRAGAVVFDRLLEDAPAWDAGIRPGDRLLSFDGRRIESANHFASLLGTYPEGWRVTVEYERGELRKAVQTRLEPLPVKLELPFPTDTEQVAAAQLNTRVSRLDASAAPADSAAAGGVAPDSAGASGEFGEPMLGAALERTVKLYGLGAGMEVGYGTGILVGEDGRVLTVLSLLIEARRVTATVRDGTAYDAIVVRRDPARQLALLQLVRPKAASTGASGVADAPDAPAPAVAPDAAAPSPPQGAAVLDAAPQDAAPQESAAPPSPPLRLPFFALDASHAPRPGDAVVALGNPFRIADGREPLSLAHGVLSARIPLDATRRMKDYPYHGDVLVFDAITSNPGFSGGALVDAEGRLLGLIGREVRLNRTHTHLNYALPTDVLAAFMDDAERGEPGKAPSSTSAATDKPIELGIRLVEAGYRTTLPFVERVVAGSPAAKAGLRVDDLILAVNGREVPDARAFKDIVAALSPSGEVEIILRRGREIVTVHVPAAGKE